MTDWTKNETTVEREGLLAELWKLWKNYMDFYVVENKHLKRILFHTFLGVILNNKGINYIESARHKTIRISTFIIQDSGTGKSESMKALKEIVKYLGIATRFTQKDNEASASGSVFMEKGSNKVVIKKGHLADKMLYCWDEGSTLLETSAYMDRMTDVFQGVMDEPGWVSKGMRLGTVEYPSPSTIVAGSYMFGKFRDTLVKKGFLQRMYISYKEFDENEKRNMRIGVNLLKRNVNFKRINELKSALRKTLQRIEPPKDNHILFDPLDLVKFDKILEDVYQDRIEKQFLGEKQTVLETFYNRLHTLIDKIAAQRAIVNGKKVVKYEDMMYGLQECGWHLKSLLNLFDYLYSGATMTQKESRETIVINNILQRGKRKLTQKEILNKTRELKIRGEWDLGYKRTIYLLERMVLERKIYSENTRIDGKIEKTYYVK